MDHMVGMEVEIDSVPEDDLIENLIWSTLESVELLEVLVRIGYGRARGHQ